MYYRQNNDFADPAQDEIKRSRKIQLISFVILIVLILGYTLWQCSGSGSMKMQWTETAFSVTDPANQTHSVALDDLEKISFRPQWDPGKCVEGGEDKLYRYGTWNNEELGDYRLYAFKGSPSVILLGTATETTVFNYESDRITKELYESILSMLDEKGYTVETE